MDPTLGSFDQHTRRRRWSLQIPRRGRDRSGSSDVYRMALGKLALSSSTAALAKAGKASVISTSVSPHARRFCLAHAPRHRLAAPGRRCEPAIREDAAKPSGVGWTPPGERVSSAVGALDQAAGADRVRLAARGAHQRSSSSSQKPSAPNSSVREGRRQCAAMASAKAWLTA